MVHLVQLIDQRDHAGGDDDVEHLRIAAGEFEQGGAVVSLAELGGFLGDDLASGLGPGGDEVVASANAGRVVFVTARRRSSCPGREGI